MAYKTFVAGEEALASDINTYLMSQTVSRHASASARNAAITAPVKGQMTVLDTDIFQPEIYTGTAWAVMGGFYQRWFHSTGWGDFSAGISGVGLGLPAISFPRAASFSYDLEIFVTIQAGQNGPGSAQFQLTNTGFAPVFQPFSAFSLTGAFAITIPFKGFFRNVPANTTIAANATMSVGAGPVGINVGAISGSVTAFPPGSEF